MLIPIPATEWKTSPWGELLRLCLMFMPKISGVKETDAAMDFYLYFQSLSGWRERDDYNWIYWRYYSFYSYYVSIRSFLTGQSGLVHMSLWSIVCLTRTVFNLKLVAWLLSKLFGKSAISIPWEYLIFVSIITSSTSFSGWRGFALNRSTDSVSSMTSISLDIPKPMDKSSDFWQRSSRMKPWFS